MILEAIYNGELFAAEMVVPKSTEYSDARKAVAELMNELERKLGKEDYAKVKELYDTMAGNKYRYKTSRSSSTRI